MTGGSSRIWPREEAPVTASPSPLESPGRPRETASGRESPPRERREEDIMLNRSQVIACAAALVACSGAQDDSLAQNSAFTATEIAQFDEPWSMSFLPDGRLLVAREARCAEAIRPERRQDRRRPGRSRSGVRRPGRLRRCRAAPEVRGQPARLFELRGKRRPRHAPARRWRERSSCSWATAASSPTLP